MKISICIPVMGRGRLLARALYSIFMQDYDDIEIVIKDGDPDHSVMSDPYVAGAFAPNNRPITVKYAVGKDNGIFPAVNDCLQRATGNILYFMCSDDLLCPGALQTVADTFAADRFGGAMWAYGQTVSADFLGRTLGIDGAPPDWNVIRKGNCIGQPSVFWNRQMMDLAGVFDPRYKHAADYDLWLRFWERRDPVYINQTLGVFCHHENQDTVIHGAETEKEARHISWRHSAMGKILTAARSRWITKQAYDGENTPVAHDEIG